MTTLTLTKADITTQKVDCIVNAANTWLLGGGGVDGAIHKAAGPKLLEECRTLNGCEVGEAKITKGYNLPAKFVIHTVGPFYDPRNDKIAEKLASCYSNTLKLAKQNGMKTIAFPSISTGVYSYPVNEASKIAVETVSNYIKQNPNDFDEIRFVAFTDDVYSAYKETAPDLKILEA